MKRGDLCEDPRPETRCSISLSESWYSGRAGKKMLQNNSSLREGEAVAQINLQGVWNIWANIWLQRPLASRKPQTNTVVKRNHLWNSTKEIWKKPLLWRRRVAAFQKSPHWGSGPNLHTRVLLKHTSKTTPQEFHFQVTSVPKPSFQMNDGRLFSSWHPFVGHKDDLSVNS